ncbi:thioredoxin family protein [Flavobacterium agrisoli]|uniref:Thioredoxin family protein n=1 Tax=Flavobacterium agrisoli TaxID=2793066 RepID=A0A934UI36_9FLAO|nr:thioredoxin family protein [Flavobacterium agrisoli]MBK0368204.1 thioredoxin family protein [Flavobacterium agrisoli]
MRLLLSLLFTFIFHFSWSQTDWKPNNITFEEALNQSKTNQKPIFLMLYADWCPHCNTMKSNTFSDPKVMEYLNEKFVCVWKNIESEEGKKLKEKFQTNGLPIFLYLDSNQNVLYSVKGEMNTKQFITETSYALNPKLQLPFLKNQFLEDQSNPEKCLLYLQILLKGNDRKSLSEPAHLYLKTQKDTELLTEINWRIISFGVSDIESTEFQYVLNHKKEFEKLTSESRVDKKINNIVTELLDPYLSSLDSLNYFKSRKIAKSIQLPKIDSLIYTYDLTFAERSKNWKFYKTVALENTDKYSSNDYNKLNEITTVFYKEIGDTNALQQAIVWEKRALALNNSAETNTILAQLYFKTKDKKLAMEYAENAKNIITEMGWNTKDINLLINKIKTQ